MPAHLGDQPPSGTDEVVIRPLDQPGDLGWVLLVHGELYADEFGWSTEAVTARILADFAERSRSSDEAAWIAELAGRRVGCVFCVRVDDETAKLRLLLVDPAVRGRRLGHRLVDQCIDFAGRAGYRRLVLWTNEPLAAARRIYLAAGFRLVAESRHDAFGPELLGQEYELDLADRPASSGVTT